MTSVSKLQLSNEDELRIVEAVQERVRDNWTYVPDPEKHKRVLEDGGVMIVLDLWTPGRRAWWEKSGDCEDEAAAKMWLLRLNGIPKGRVWVAVGWVKASSRSGASFGHAACVYITPDGEEKLLDNGATGYTDVIAYSRVADRFPFEFLLDEDTRRTLVEV